MAPGLIVARQCVPKLVQQNFAETPGAEAALFRVEPNSTIRPCAEHEQVIVHGEHMVQVALRRASRVVRVVPVVRYEACARITDAPSRHRSY